MSNDSKTNAEERSPEVYHERGAGGRLAHRGRGVEGHVLFRRDLNGTLDVIYARDKVLATLEHLRAGVELTSHEQVAISCILPDMFDFIDPIICMHHRMIHGLSDEECKKVAWAVASHIKEEKEYRVST